MLDFLHQPAVDHVTFSSLFRIPSSPGHSLSADQAVEPTSQRPQAVPGIPAGATTDPPNGREGCGGHGVDENRAIIKQAVADTDTKDRWPGRRFHSIHPMCQRLCLVLG